MDFSHCSGVIIYAKVIKAHKRTVETTEMNWEVFLPSIYHVLKKVASYEGVKKIIVTENGTPV